MHGSTSWRPCCIPLGATPDEVALIAEMLGVPGGERYPPLALSPERKKEQTFGALIRILDERARRSPVLMLFEDAHWADPSSLELLDRLIMRLASLPVLVVISFRPEFQAPWVGQAGVTLIALSRLSPRQAATLASQVVVGQALPAGMLERIVAQTDGVPLFIEELTKAVLEGASQPDVAALGASGAEHLAGFTDGTAGSAAGRKAGGADRRGYRPRVQP